MSAREQRTPGVPSRHWKSITRSRAGVSATVRLTANALSAGRVPSVAPVVASMRARSTPRAATISSPLAATMNEEIPAGPGTATRRVSAPVSVSMPTSSPLGHDTNSSRPSIDRSIGRGACSAPHGLQRINPRASSRAGSEPEVPKSISWRGWTSNGEKSMGRADCVPVGM